MSFHLEGGLTVNGKLGTHCTFDSSETRRGDKVYTDTTVRRLIAEAVAAERERATEEANRRANASWSLMAKKMVEAEREDCIAALDALEGWSYDDPASSAIAAIRSRGDQT